MRKATYFAFAAGVALFIYLIAHEGVATIIAALSIAGWSLLWVALFRTIPMILSSLGWFKLFSGTRFPPPLLLLWARWIGESFNTLMPVAQIGGHFVRARLIKGCGVANIDAGATVVVDFTLGISAQFVFSLVGAALLLWQIGDGEELPGLLIGFTIAAFLLLAFYLIQRAGFFSYAAGFIQSVVRRRELISLAGGAKALDQKIAMIYRSRSDVLFCSALRLLSWMSKSGETWLALYFLGFPITLREAVIIESLSAAVGSAAFVIPGALGVKEGGIILIGKLLGISTEKALALALVKRFCDLLVGGPGLIAWLASEARRQ
jgi:putative membrane protein